MACEGPGIAQLCWGPETLVYHYVGCQLSPQGDVDQVLVLVGGQQEDLHGRVVISHIQMYLKHPYLQIQSEVKACYSMGYESEYSKNAFACIFSWGFSYIIRINCLRTISILVRSDNNFALVELIIYS